MFICSAGSAAASAGSAGSTGSAGYGGASDGWGQSGSVGYTGDAGHGHDGLLSRFKIVLNQISIIYSRFSYWVLSLSISSKYVAINRGSIHVAPLVGHTQSVKSQNYQPAPGTTWWTF